MHELTVNLTVKTISWRKNIGKEIIRRSYSTLKLPRGFHGQSERIPGLEAMLAQYLCFFGELNSFSVVAIDHKCFEA